MNTHKCVTRLLLNDGGTPLYSLYEIAGFTDGTMPGHDWYDTFMNDAASMQRYNVNISGGNNRVKYLVNAGYLHQNSPIDAEKNDNYNPALKLHRFNILANVDVTLHRYLNCFLNTNVTIDRINQRIQRDRRYHEFDLSDYPPYLDLSPKTEK